MITFSKVSYTEERFIGVYWKDDECYSVSASIADGEVQSGQLTGPRHSQSLSLDRHTRIIAAIHNHIAQERTST